MTSSSAGSGHPSPSRALAVAAGAVALLAGQAPPGLDLGASVEPPPLGESSYVEHVRGTLENEILALYQEERSAQDPRRAALRAGINYRIMAAELLVQGAPGREGEWVSALTGLRLAHGRSFVDDALAEDGGADSAGVARFNEDTIDLAHRLRTTDPAELDEAVARIMWSLARALRPALAREPVSHWTVIDADASVPAPPARTRPTLAALRARVETTSLGSETRALLVEILGFLQRGARFPDLRPAVETLRGQLADLLDFADVTAAATWMSDALRAEQIDAAERVVAALRDPSRRAEGERDLETLAARGRFFARLSVLRELKGDPRPLVAALGSAGADADADGDADDAAGETARRERLERILDRMIRYRRLAPAPLPRDLRVAMGKLGQEYEAAEKQMIDRIDAIVRADGLTDPLLASLVADQAQYLEDVGRLARAADWVEAVGALDSRAAPAFQRQLRKMSRWLLDVNRRADAVTAMDQFEAQLAMVAPLAFEDALAARTPAAIVASGGRDQELLGVIRATRRAWAEAWGRGDAGSAAAARLILISRLTQTMAGCAEVLDPGEAPVRLDRWSAWEMRRTMIARGSAEVPNRLKLATAAAVDGDDDQVAEQLERLDRDAPITRLIGRLSAALERELAPLPDGLAGLLGQVLYPPPADAWMLDAREELARVCRYAMEADFAWGEGRDEEGAELQAYVNARAAALLRRLDAPGRLVPPVAGFDGSDPEADEVTRDA